MCSFTKEKASVVNVFTLRQDSGVSGFRRCVSPPLPRRPRPPRLCWSRSGKRRAARRGPGRCRGCRRRSGGSCAASTSPSVRSVCRTCRTDTVSLRSAGGCARSDDACV